MREPSIAIVVDARTGEITNVSVLARGIVERHDGYATIQALRHELETFEQRVRDRLTQFAKQQ